MKMSKVVFISTPALGNLVPTIEFAKVLLTRTNQNLSATILLINIPQRPLVQSYIDSLTTTTTAAAEAGKIHFHHLPAAAPPAPDKFEATIAFLSLLIDNHKPQVKDALVNLMSSTTESAHDSATFLSFMLHLPSLDARVTTEFADSADTEFDILGFSNFVPVKVFPTFMLKRQVDGYSWFLHHATRYRETKGIIVNTFQELEPFCLSSLVNDGTVPPVYPIGPVLDHNGPAQWHQDSWGHETVMKWLDGQEPSSVVFLSFGSMGSLSSVQVREIATGLERTGFPFLWAIREPPKGKLDLPQDYTNLEDVLPCGFMERTNERGLICGWVPQVTILAHKAIGGFVSHCGWNSILESLYYGVPIGTWPIYAEQHLNAFELVKELKIGVEITMDYRDGNTLVTSEEVANGVRKLMDCESEVRHKVKSLSEDCKEVWKENGSSSILLRDLVDKLMDEV